MRDESRPACELRRVAGHAVVEARADGDQEIAILDGVVRERRAVHAEHAHGQRMRGVDQPMPMSVVTTGISGPRRARAGDCAAAALITPPPA